MTVAKTFLSLLNMHLVVENRIEGANHSYDII